MVGEVPHATRYIKKKRESSRKVVLGVHFLGGPMVKNLPCNVGNIGLFQVEK